MATSKVTKAASKAPATKAARKVAPKATKPAAPAPVQLVSVAVGQGQAVAAVTVNPAQVYRTKAAHNVAWWQQLTSAMAANPLAANGLNGAVAVAPMLANPQNPGGVPSHFVGYCLRRGYLVKVA